MTTPNKASASERATKANLAYKSGMRGNEPDPARFMMVPNSGLEMPPLEMPQASAASRGSDNPEFSALNLKKDGPGDGTKTLEETAEERIKNAEAKGDGEDEPEETDDSDVFKSGMRGRERRPKRARRQAKRRDEREAERGREADRREA